eukprot:scaffold2875_cov247-Pinguiococcus_pyrenoidosus.AAC.17
MTAVSGDTHDCRHDADGLSGDEDVLVLRGSGQNVPIDPSDLLRKELNEGCCVSHTPRSSSARFCAVAARLRVEGGGSVDAGQTCLPDSPLPASNSTYLGDLVSHWADDLVVPGAQKLGSPFGALLLPLFLSSRRSLNGSPRIVLDPTPVLKSSRK